MPCPYLRKYYTGGRDGVVTRYSCSMGVNLYHIIPEYCQVCGLNPEGVGDVDPRD